MYSFHIGVIYLEFEDVVSMRREAYSYLKNEGDCIPIYKDDKPYGKMHLLDDGAWMFTLADKQYTKIRRNGAVQPT